MTLPARGQVTQFNAHVEVRPGTLSIASDGQAIRFKDVMVDYTRPRTTEAVSCPVFTIVDATGSGRGWHVQVSVSDLVSAEGRTIPGGNLAFVGSGGRAQVLKMNSPGFDGLTGPSEVDRRVVLSGTQVLSSRPGHGQGQFRWFPRPEQFVLEVGPEVPPGVYRGQVTFTLISRP